MAQSLPIIKEYKKPKFFAELFHCDLCLGVWVYFVVFAFSKIQITESLFGLYIPVVSEFASAMIVSFIVHLTLLGAKVRWGTFEV